MFIFPLASLFCLFSFILFLTFISETRDYQDERLNFPYRFSNKGFPRILRSRSVDRRSDFLETTGNEMAGTSLYVMISFHKRDALCTFSRHAVLVRPGFRLFYALLGVLFSPVYSVLRSLIKQNTTAMTTNTMVV